MKYRVIEIFSIGALVAASLVIVQTQNSNIALSATATASRDNPSRGQSVAKAKDGVVGGYPSNITAEWVAPGQLAGAWIRLTWPGTVTAAQVVLHDRVNTVDQIVSGVLRFSDGSSVAVGTLANDGTGTAINFSARQISWVQFDITSARGENTGLAEFEVFGSGGTSTPTPPTTPPTTLSCMPGTQSVVTGQAANFSANGGTGSFAWSAPGGTPASGSAASFSTTYASAGTKNVTVTRGGTNATCQAVVTAPPPTTPTPPPTTPPTTPTGTLIFQNGWERRTELGCTLNGILDGTGGRSAVSWDDFGPSFPGLCPVAQVVNTGCAEGSRCLQITQVPGQNGSETYNGTDFRMDQVFSPSQQEFYAVFYVKYAAEWVWATADHKILITGGSDFSQNVYLNVRGHGNGSPGYVVVHVLPSDTRFDSPINQMSVGVWHKMELHVVAGAHGRVDVKVDGVTTPFGTGVDGSKQITDVNTGAAFGYFKMDTTYNAGTSIPYQMNQWFDGFAVYAGRGTF